MGELRQPGITIWTSWSGDEITGCGALKELDAHHAESKSICTSVRFQRRGVATRLLEHIKEEARLRGYECVSLKAGTEDYFEPARRFYERFDFCVCEPLAHYVEDPASIFITRDL